MPERKTKEEIQKWLADKKRKKGDRIVVAEVPTTSPAVGQLKKEIEVL